jgi:AbiV family abortive infection protein
MPKKADPVVPREALRPGVAKCLEVSGWRLREASGLLDADPPPTVTAAILFTFGIEEFGKAVLLRRALETGEPTAKIAGFYDHRAKIDAAGEHIPEERLLLHRGAFQRNFVQKNAFDLGNSADLEARLDGLYVDWDSNGWTVGVRVDPSVLSDNIAAVADIIQQKQTEWQDVE